MNPGRRSDLLAETKDLLRRPRPLQLPSALGCSLLRRMVETNSTGTCANQHFFVVNARNGFFDPHRTTEEKGYKGKGKGKGKRFPRPEQIPWDSDTNHHLGYLPLNLQGIVSNQKFKPTLYKLAYDIYTSLQLCQSGLQLDEAHVLFWCNQGCHRSVSFCRLVQIAAEQWGWTNPSCN